MENGKQKTTEMGNRKRQKWETVHALCIQQHLLEWISATGVSGEEVETIGVQHMHQLNTLKNIIDRPLDRVQSAMVA